MVGKTEIEWTDVTWNPATGCTKVSQGCKNCYAEKMASRLKLMGQKKYVNGFKYTEHFEDISKPLSWKKPSKIFVNSMSDLFHEEATELFLNAVFDLMFKADWHIFQILTKRPQRARDFIKRYLRDHYYEELPEHIWIGTSVENQEVSHRIDTLKEIPAKIRFISAEPLIGPLAHNLDGIHWLIAGGESGDGFRQVQKEWIVGLRDLCKKHHVKFFFKQWGGIRPKAGGRELDGQIYDEYPLVQIKRRESMK